MALRSPWYEIGARAAVWRAAYPWNARSPKAPRATRARRDQSALRTARSALGARGGDMTLRASCSTATCELPELRRRDTPMTAALTEWRGHGAAPTPSAAALKDA